MATQSVANRIQVLSTHTTASPLSVALGETGPSLVVTIVVRNVGVARFLVRGNVAAGTTSSWTNLGEGEEANLALQSSSATASLAIEFAKVSAEPRYISMYDAVTQDIPGQAQIERYD
jgi:hypothetical protein